MADQQPPSKRPRSESPLLPSALKVRRLDNAPAESAPVSPPDSTKSVKSDSSPPGPKQQQQPESVSNSSPNCPVVARPVKYTGLALDILEGRIKTLDPVAAAKSYHEEMERWDQMRETRLKWSEAEHAQYVIDFRREHNIPDPTPGPKLCADDIIFDLEYYSPSEDEQSEDESNIPDPKPGPKIDWDELIDAYEHGLPIDGFIH